jgi:DNA-binding NarL/FixJ family response regulator
MPASPPVARDTIRVVVVDDHEAVRTGLERVFQRAPGIEAVAVLHDGGELFALLHNEPIDVVILDYDLERGDGLSWCLRIKERMSRVAVLIYSGYAGPGLVFAGGVAQADAVLSKAEPVRVLLDAVQRLAGGERLLDPSAPELFEAAAALLEPEDLPLMALLRDGASHVEIARILDRKESDVVRRARRIVGLLQGGRQRGPTPLASHGPLHELGGSLAGNESSPHSSTRS